MPRRRVIHPIHEHVQEILFSADPFFRGPHRGSPPPLDEDIQLLDERKTLRDLGRLDDGTHGHPRFPPGHVFHPDHEPHAVGPDTDDPMIMSHKRSAL